MSLGQPRRQAGREGSAPRYRVATRRRIPPASRLPASLPRPAAMAGLRWAGPCAALAVLLAAWSLPRGGSAGRLFLNEWAAEIPAGPDAARAIADELDYDLVGQVRPGGGLPRRRIPQDGLRQGSFPIPRDSFPPLSLKLVPGCRPRGSGEHKAPGPPPQPPRVRVCPWRRARDGFFRGDGARATRFFFRGPGGDLRLSLTGSGRALPFS